MAEAPPAGGRGWFKRLRTGLSRSAGALGGGIGKLLTKRRIDDETLQELEDLLVSADLGVATAQAVTRQLAATHRGKEAEAVDVRRALAAEIARILEPVAVPIALDPNRKPFVILVAGVNGTGKTTTIGKLAHWFRQDGKQVVLAAGDTFRAAAIDQLRIWGERAGAEVVSGKVGGDAAGLAFDAYQKACEAKADVLLIDTAGRLQNKADLMAELTKITRVIGKIDDSAPHASLLVLDATTGQNAHSQVELFREAGAITGLIMTKLDGTARGGILVALAERFGLPIHAIGVGEGIEDLQPFDAESFASALVGE
jgi:fused signal recognition particle receptor